MRQEQMESFVGRVGNDKGAKRIGQRIILGQIERNLKKAARHRLPFLMLASWQQNFYLVDW